MSRFWFDYTKDLLQPYAERGREGYADSSGSPSSAAAACCTQAGHAAHPVHRARLHHRQRLDQLPKDRQVCGIQLPEGCGSPEAAGPSTPSTRPDRRPRRRHLCELAVVLEKLRFPAGEVRHQAGTAPASPCTRSARRVRHGPWHHIIADTKFGLVWMRTATWCWAMDLTDSSASGAGGLRAGVTASPLSTSSSSVTLQRAIPTATTICGRRSTVIAKYLEALQSCSPARKLRALFQQASSARCENSTWARSILYSRPLARPLRQAQCLAGSFSSSADTALQPAVPSSAVSQLHRAVQFRRATVSPALQGAGIGLWPGGRCRRPRCAVHPAAGCQPAPYRPRAGSPRARLRSVMQGRHHRSRSSVPHPWLQLLQVIHAVGVKMQVGGHPASPEFSFRRPRHHLCECAPYSAYISFLSRARSILAHTMGEAHCIRAT